VARDLPVDREAAAAAFAADFADEEPEAYAWVACCCDGAAAAVSDGVILDSDALAGGAAAACAPALERTVSVLRAGGVLGDELGPAFGAGGVSAGGFDAGRTGAALSA
jgi:hypothetical protein